MPGLCFVFVVRTGSHEKNVSAEQSAPRAHPRIPCPHGHQGRPQSDQCATRKGSGEALSVRESRNDTDDFRFPRDARLLNPEAFTRVFREGFRSSDQFFTMLAAPRAGGPSRRETGRLGMAISRKVAPSAVSRNRIKRQIRESFRHRRQEFPELDFVVMARPSARLATTAELSLSLDRHWKRLVSRCSESSKR